MYLVGIATALSILQNISMLAIYKCGKNSNSTSKKIEILYKDKIVNKTKCQRG
jgi:hypothetical protein